MVQCKRCGIELSSKHEGAYCYPCEAEVDWKVKTGVFKVCQRCGVIIPGKTGPNTKYCDECKKEVRREQVRRDVKKHINKIGKEEWNKKSREAMERYREHWGWGNKNELLGSGRLSPKMNPDFDAELKIIRWEKRRLGIKEYDSPSQTA